jgi:hypothetical protein
LALPCYGGPTEGVNEPADPCGPAYMLAEKFQVSVLCYDRR